MQDRNHLTQRADYTQKFNAGLGRHGWIRLTPAYSVRIVEELLGSSSIDQTVLDPFCGSGTTVLAAANRGHSATTIDINPFLVWFTQLKTSRFSDSVIDQSVRTATKVLELVTHRLVDPIPEPPIYRIDRWWSQPAREFLCYLKSAIDRLTNPGHSVRNLLYVAFCRTLMSLSFASFNHQSMSLKKNRQLQLPFEVPFESVFSEAVNMVIHSARYNPIGRSTVILGDSRQLESTLSSHFDIVITSPPYANRMSYIRELRPYMYWLGYLENRTDAGEMDWTAIGGTWGIATSRLAHWTCNDECWVPEYLVPLLDQVSSNKNASGRLLANYISKYCVDMSRHFKQLINVLRDGSRVHYIVGNSIFYGVVIPTEEIYAAFLRHYGFQSVSVRPIRKRNSKKKLFEFDVSGIA